MTLQNAKNNMNLDAMARWVDSPPTNSLFLVAWAHKLVRVILITYREFQTNNLSLRSGALTYAMLLSLVPMLAMSTAVVKGLGGGNQLREVVYRYIDTLEQHPVVELEDPDATADEDIPTVSAESPDTQDGLTAHLRSAVDQLFDYVDRTSFATLGTFGMLGIFLSVILVLNHIETAMNTIWQVEAGRSLIRKVTDYLTLMVLMPLSINVALAAGTILESQTLNIHIDKFVPISWIQILLLKGVPIFFLSITLYIVYLFFPNTKPKPLPTLIGALLAGSLWFISQNIYIGLQIGVAKYNAIYGSFATVPLFLIWIYFGWLFVLLGAQVAYAIEKCPRYQLIENNDAPSIKLSAALDVCLLVKQNFIEKKDTGADSISKYLPAYSEDQLREAISLLVSTGVLHHSRETNQIMPSMPPEIITHDIIIKAVLGTAGFDSYGGKMTNNVIEAATAVGKDINDDHVSAADAAQPDSNTLSDPTDK